MNSVITIPTIAPNYDVTIATVPALLAAFEDAGLIDESDNGYDYESMLVMQWCASQNAHYYAADSFDFSLSDADHDAKFAGKSIVVVDNLS